MIHPSLWDDDQFVALTVESRLLWLFFKSAEAPVPGILRGSILTFAEALRFSQDQIESCLRELIERNRIELADSKRLCRIIDSVDPPPNRDVVCGWFRKWQALPDCQLKYGHIETLESSVLSRKKRWASDVWAETFGQILNPYNTRPYQPPLSAVVPNRDRVHTVPTQCGDRVDIVKNPNVNDASMLHGVDTVSTRSDPEQDQAPDPDPDPEDHGVPRPYAMERRLWEIQEEYRGALRLPKLIPTDEDLEGVRAGLEATGFGEAEAELALRAHFVECRDNASKGRHFNGTTNWRPKNLRIAATRQSARGGNGSAERDLGAEARKAAAEPQLQSSDLDAFRASWAGKPEGAS